MEKVLVNLNSGKSLFLDFLNARVLVNERERELTPLEKATKSLEQNAITILNMMGIKAKTVKITSIASFEFFIDSDLYDVDTFVDALKRELKKNGVEAILTPSDDLTKISIKYYFNNNENVVMDILNNLFNNKVFSVSSSMNIEWSITANKKINLLNSGDPRNICYRLFKNAVLSGIREYNCFLNDALFNRNTFKFEIDSNLLSISDVNTLINAMVSKELYDYIKTLENSDDLFCDILDLINGETALNRQPIRILKNRKVESLIEDLMDFKYYNLFSDLNIFNNFEYAAKVNKLLK